jgi:hypothetical protein
MRMARFEIKGGGRFGAPPNQYEVGETKDGNAAIFPVSRDGSRKPLELDCTFDEALAELDAALAGAQPIDGD